MSSSKKCPASTFNVEEKLDQDESWSMVIFHFEYSKRSLFHYTKIINNMLFDYASINVKILRIMKISAFITKKKKNYYITLHLSFLNDVFNLVTMFILKVCKPPNL